MSEPSVVWDTTTNKVKVSVDTLQPAYLLHSRPYRESSSILELFTPEQGRVAMVARNVRRKKSPLQPLLQLYRPLLISWRGRGPLYTLQQAEPDGAMWRLGGMHMVSGFYINELLVRLLPHEEPFPALYATYELLLQHLSQGDDKATLEWLLRQFELRLLRELGYGLHLGCEIEHGEVIEPQRRYCYVLEQGPVLWRNESMQGVMLHGETLLELARGELNSDQSRREAKRLMRALLGVMLGSKPLHSRELMRQML